ncbi:MAG: prepilin-type N-terminal cleavage/methylation domain-containing protein [Firmicutes bacterium]|nr:prepilin-type N-terminal cleavage/methylation domain-containing protein [Bacillota bacterium]
MKNQRQKGFTLMEVMVAVSIIALAVIPLSKMYIQGKRNTTSNWHTIQAINMVQGIVETQKVENYNSVQSSGWQQVENPTAKWDWNYKVTVVEESHHLKTITVKLRYSEQGVEKEVSFTILKGQR